MTGLAYVDASALVKLIIDEVESLTFLRWFVEAERVVTSRVGMIETRRASDRRPHDAAHRDVILGELEVIELNPRIAERASAVLPPSIRTLDAIHLATAIHLLPDLDAFVTYDDRLADAARALGLPVVRPA